MAFVHGFLTSCTAEAQQLGLARCNGAEAAQFAGAEVSLEQFRARVVECSRDQQAGFLCLNYNRAVLDQTGTG